MPLPSTSAPMSPASTRTFQRSVSEASDWDRSISVEPEFDPEAQASAAANGGRVTPRNSVLFPAGDTTPGRSTAHPPMLEGGVRGERTLSELLKLHAEKGTTCAFTLEEADRVGDVLGQWINSSSSPYEGDDDFFVRGKDDMFIPRKAGVVETGRLRGMSEAGAGSRPPSSAGFFQQSSSSS